MSRPLLSVLLAAALALLLSAAVAAPASAARKCSLSASQQRSLGASYTLSLRVKGVSCRKGKRVSRAFHVCRKRNGGADGRCKRRVARFRCSESRFNRIRTSYDSRVTCRRGGKRVWFTYTMFT